MSDKAIAILSELHYIWKWLARDTNGDLLVYTSIPRFHDVSKRLTITTGNVIDITHFDNGAFDSVNIGDIVRIDQYTVKTF